MPDILIGLFLSLAARDSGTSESWERVMLVAAAVASFTLIVESRKIFFYAGEMERFYFIRPNIVSRATSYLTVVCIAAALVLSVYVPFLAFMPGGIADTSALLASFLSSVFISLSFYFAAVILISLLPSGSVNVGLTMIQLVTAVVLVVIFQLSSDLPALGIRPDYALVSALVFAFLSFIVLTQPAVDRVVDGLNSLGSGGPHDLVRVVDRIRRPARIRKGEEEAGFILFLSNLLRNPSFRLSSLAIAATPVTVAVYWSLQGRHFVPLSSLYGFSDLTVAAPIASLVVSGVVVHYFIAQSVVTTRETGTSWFMRVNAPFDVGRFVLGVRKSLLISLQLPMTALILITLAFRSTPADSFLAAVTFYSLTHIAASWFSVMQRRFPFSVPFTRFGPVDGLSLVFMISYSVFVTVLIFFSCTGVRDLLMLNVFAFILIGIMETFSVKIVNKRIGTIG